MTEWFEGSNSVLLYIEIETSEILISRDCELKCAYPVKPSGFSEDFHSLSENNSGKKYLLGYLVKIRAFLFFNDTNNIALGKSIYNFMKYFPDYYLGVYRKSV